MASLKETPRQKMMGILYLVLLGLAATTVTDHVLDAFRNLRLSLETSTNNVRSTVDNTFSTFEATKLKNEPDRARPIYNRAVKVKSYAKELDAYIENIKTVLIKEGGGMDEASQDVKARADVDLSPRYMLRKARGENGIPRAVELKTRINDTRNKILNELSTKEREGLKLALNAEDPKTKSVIKTTWEQDNFGDGIPLTAALTALTKIQADLKNTEADVVKKILGEVDKAVINLDRFDAVAVAPTSYILVGQTYQAEVFLTASDSKTQPEVAVGGQVLRVQEGKGLYTVTGSREGEFKWAGTVRVKQSDGTMKEYKTKEQTYTVAKPSAVVSPDKMNVFYIGVDNPVSVSAPGIAKEKIRVSISSGSISGAAGHYNVKVSTPGAKAIVSVSGDFGNGKSSVLGTTEFRIKRIPPPRIEYGGKSGGRMGTGAMKAQNRIFAVLKDFDFDAPFSVSHFTLYIMKPRSEPQVFESNNNAFTPAMQSAMNGIVPGSRVVFDNVFATGPDGMKRQLDPIMFTVD
ncbi:MAG: gliding motility protein GldM [Bacteroidota bacterium]